MNKLKVTKQTTEAPDGWSSPGESMSPSPEYIKAYNKDHPKNPIPKNATISKSEQKKFKESGFAIGYTGPPEPKGNPRPKATVNPKPAAKPKATVKQKTAAKPKPAAALPPVAQAPGAGNYYMDAHGRRLEYKKDPMNNKTIDKFNKNN